MSLFKTSSFISTLFGKMRAEKWRRFFTRIKKKKNPILLLSQRRLPFVLRATNYFPVASEGDSATWLQNQRTGAGGVEGGGSRGQMERKEIREGRMDGGRGHGKRRASRGEKCQIESKLQRVVSVKGTTMCLRAPEANNEESTGQNNRSTLPFRRSVNSNLNIHPPSLGANMPPPFDICFTL